MKKFLASILFIVVSLIAESQSNIDVLHYKFEIELSDQSDTIKGKAFVEVKFLENTNQFFLNLTSRNQKGKGMIAYRALREGEAVSSAHGQDSLFLRLSIPAKKDEVRTYEILYEGVPADGLIISKNKYGDKTFFADNWPDRAHQWIPCIDRPDDKASFEFIVTAPSQYSVVSNGVKTEERVIDNGKRVTHWKEDAALSTKVMVIGVANFAVKSYADSPAGIPVSAWVYQQDSLPGFRNYSVAPSILKFFISYIGPYPYEKLANVQSKTIFGGMENASAIFYEETSAALFQNIESLFAHEIVHQWFGDMATEKSFPHLWLSEGFATYLTHIYIESKYGKDSLNTEMRKDRNEIIDFTNESDLPVVDSVSPLMKLLNTNSYQKGGWILHMLRRQLGDSVFHKIIRSYYAAYAGKNADTRDFQKVCENESGKDLSVFFDQWLYSPGLPKLTIQWNYDAKNKMVLLNIKQSQSKPFTFPLDIQLRTTSGKLVRETLEVSKSTQQFLIRVKEKINRVIADPAVSLLFQGTVSEAGR